MQSSKIRIGTRGSPLALVQANIVAKAIGHAHGLAPDDIEIVVIRTTGDRVQDRALSELGGKGLFTKEIDEALLAGDIDMAVHSMKDVPTTLPPGLVIPTLLPREDPRDAFISSVADHIAGLPRGARVGSASLRRAAQLRRLRPDVEVVNFRGNVDTRLKKLGAGEVQATFLALAGIRRLGLEAHVTSIVDETDMLPAVAQGAIGIQIREDDAPIRQRLSPLGDKKTAVEIACEREFLATLDGSCRTPIAGLARLEDGRLLFTGRVVSPDGSQCLDISAQGRPSEAVALGREAGQNLLARGAGRLVAS